MPADLIAILDTLRLHLIALSSTDPYYRSRLLRIIQQLEYVVQACPSEDWPVKRPPASSPRIRQLQGMVLTQPQFQGQIRQLQSALWEDNQSFGSYAWHQQLLDLILCLI